MPLAKEQDGSEVRSVELERLTAEGVSLIERRNAFEAFRDLAAAEYEAITGSAWRPHSGSMSGIAKGDGISWTIGRQRSGPSVS
jgi:hypothetical protein